MSALVVAAAVRDGRIVLCNDYYKALAARACKKWGDGVSLQIRIEPEDEAWRYADAKHLYGHLYTPVSRRTGETVAEVHLRMKAAYMPDDGRTSITELNRDEMKSFIESIEQDIRETDPDSWEDCIAAMALYYEHNAQKRRTA